MAGVSEMGLVKPSSAILALRIESLSPVSPLKTAPFVFLSYHWLGPTPSALPELKQMIFRRSGV